MNSNQTILLLTKVIHSTYSYRNVIKITIIINRTSIYPKTIFFIYMVATASILYSREI